MQPMTAAPTATSPSAGGLLDQPIWTWPGPRELDRWPAELLTIRRREGQPCVQVAYAVPPEAASPDLGEPGARRPRRRSRDGDELDEVQVDARSAASLPVYVRWWAVTPQTRDAAWWRSRCPGAAYTVDLLPRGIDHPGEAVRLATVGPDDQPQPLLVEPPLSITVHLPRSGDLTAQLDRERSRDGRWRYLVADTSWWRALEALKARMRGGQ